MLAILVPILGARALIYLPVWLLGCTCYLMHQRVTLRKSIARVGAAVSALIMFAIWFSGAFRVMDVWFNSALGGWPYADLHYSSHFAVHYVSGSLAALNLFCIRYCDLNLLATQRVRKTVAYCASFSFAMYLAHQPLMDLWAFLLGHDPHSLVSLATLLAATLVSVWVFGLVSEHRKAEWRWLIGELFRRAASQGTWIRQNPFRATR